MDKFQKLNLACEGEEVESLESGEVSCVHRPNISNASICQAHKALMEYFRYLCSSVSGCMLTQTNQSTNDQKVQTLHAETSQRELIRAPTVYLR